MRDKGVRFLEIITPCNRLTYRIEGCKLEGNPPMLVCIQQLAIWMADIGDSNSMNACPLDRTRRCLVTEPNGQANNMRSFAVVSDGILRKWITRDLMLGFLSCSTLIFLTLPFNTGEVFEPDVFDGVLPLESDTPVFAPGLPFNWPLPFTGSLISHPFTDKAPFIVIREDAGGTAVLPLNKDKSSIPR